MPYYELPVYRTSGPYDIPARSLLVDYSGAFATPSTFEVRSNSIQLSQVPDKLIIFCQRATKLTGDADAHLTLTNVNITFKNNSGLCSNMTPEQLYRAFVNSGLKNMSWN